MTLKEILDVIDLDTQTKILFDSETNVLADEAETLIAVLSEDILKKDIIEIGCEHDQIKIWTKK